MPSCAGAGVRGADGPARPRAARDELGAVAAARERRVVDDRVAGGRHGARTRPRRGLSRRSRGMPRSTSRRSRCTAGGAGEPRMSKPATAAVAPSASAAAAAAAIRAARRRARRPSGESPRGGHQVGEDRLEIGRQRVACVHSHTPSSRDLRIFRARETRMRAAGPLMPRPAATAPKSRSETIRSSSARRWPASSRVSSRRERARQLGRVGAGGHLVPVGVVVRAGGDAEPLGRAALEPRAPVVLAHEVARDSPQPRHAGAGLAAAEAAEPEQRLRECLGRQIARGVRRYLGAQPGVERGRPAAVERLEGRRVRARRAQLRGVRHHW